MARDEKIMVRLSAEIKDEFQRLAEEHGVTMSALAAYVIGQYVRTQRRVIEPMTQQMAEVARQAIEHVARAAKDERVSDSVP